MPYEIPEYISIPYSDSDEEIAREALLVFDFVPDYPDTEPGSNDVPMWSGADCDIEYDSLVAKLVGILSRIRQAAKMAGGQLGPHLAEHIKALVFFWYFDLDLDWPFSTFPEPEVGHRPMAGSGADFMYMILAAIGVQFDDRTFRTQFDLGRREAATEVRYEPEFEDDDDSS